MFFVPFNCFAWCDFAWQIRNLVYVKHQGSVTVFLVFVDFSSLNGVSMK